MKRPLVFTVILFACVFSIIGQSKAQVAFHADFEDDKGPNNLDAWEEHRVSDALEFSVQDGRLKQTADGSAHSGKALLPTDASWKNYTVAADVWNRDNDAFGLVFRHTGEDSYYSLLIGGGDSGNSWSFGKNLAPEGQDFSNTPGLGDILKSGKNANPVDESGNTAYTIAVKGEGNKIEFFFGEQVDVLDGEMPPKIGEVTDASFSRGTAGICMSTNPADWDNIIVLSPEAAVVVKDKLAITWASIKRSR